MWDSLPKIIFDTRAKIVVDFHPASKIMRIAPRVELWSMSFLYFIFIRLTRESIKIYRVYTVHWKNILQFEFCAEVK